MRDGGWKEMLLGAPPPALDAVRDAADPAARHDARRRPSRLRDQGGRVRLNLTPMIDVTFLLLIFFVCTARTLDVERVFRVEVPPMEAPGADPVEDSALRLVLREPPLRIRVASAPQGAVVLIEPAFAEANSIDALERVMREALQREGHAGLFTADHPIVLEPDAECTWEDTVRAFNALVRAGYRGVGFAGSTSP
ncbi:MAG: biopolymer transporter ExbD [Phycisphaeraceae bacterium]|nr:biopolymer transporter ExbD [Phycisphaeraceae bacterium]